MPAMPPPVADERQALRDYLLQQQYSYHALAFGLTDEQARATPTASALSIGALIKHATGVQRTWMQRVSASPQAPPDDDRPVEGELVERVAHRLDRGRVGGVLVAATDLLRRGDRRIFGDADHFEHEDAVEDLAGLHIGSWDCCEGR